MHFKHTHSFRYYTTSFIRCQGHEQEYWCIYTIFTHLCCANKQVIFAMLKNVYSRINCLKPVNRSQNGYNCRAVKIAIYNMYKFSSADLCKLSKLVLADALLQYNNLYYSGRRSVNCPKYFPTKTNGYAILSATKAKGVQGNERTVICYYQLPQYVLRQEAVRDRPHRAPYQRA